MEALDVVELSSPEEEKKNMQAIALSWRKIPSFIIENLHNHDYLARIPCPLRQNKILSRFNIEMHLI